MQTAKKPHKLRGRYRHHAGLPNSSFSRRIFGILTKTGKPNAAARFLQQIRPASAEVRQIFSPWDVRSVKPDRGAGLVF
tara:strand:- start:210 stop:446 length:237 start_codon:yes stop_codon:yes gene_type:complete